MVSYKFSGHLSSNLFARAEHKTTVTELWTRSLVPLIENQFPNAGLQIIKGARTWDECLSHLFLLGAVYLDNKRLQTDALVDQTQVLRFHLMPRRFEVDVFDWNRHVVFENADYIIVNKPAMVPVHPTLDNCIENVLFKLQERYENSVYCVHRLDLETTGLMVFAKNSAAMYHFQKIFSSRVDIQKFYKAIVSKPLQNTGLLQHWMINSPKAPKQIVNSEIKNSSRIELKVLSQDRWRGEDSPASILDVQLLTGKTHQIRAQLSHLGSPLLGDRLYNGLPFSNAKLFSHFLLHAYRIDFLDPQGHTQQFERYPDWES